MLLGEGPVVLINYILSDYAVRSSGSKLRRDVVKICVVEHDGAALLVPVQDFPDLDPGAELRLG